jgi:hypothetical protein
MSKPFYEVMGLVHMVTRKPETYHYERNCEVIIPPQNNRCPNCNHITGNRILIHDQIGFYRENNRLHCSCCGDIIKYKLGDLKNELSALPQANQYKKRIPKVKTRQK